MMNDPQENHEEASDANSALRNTLPVDSRTGAAVKRNVPRIGHLNSIDFLRGIASLGVVIFHTSHAISHETTDSTISRLYELCRYGAYGVPLFFVVSGFCIHRKQAEQSAAGNDDSIPFRKYWKRRFFRLYPSYFTVCVGSALLMMGAIASGTKSTLVSNYPGNPYFYLSLDFLTHIFLLHCFFPLFDRGLGNGSLWTLAREEQYYLLYFPLLKLKRYAGIWICLGLSILVSIVTILISNSAAVREAGFSEVVESSSLALWPQWVLGMVSMEALVNRGRLISLIGNRGSLLAGLVLVAWQKEFPGPVWFSTLVFAFGFFLVVSALSKMEVDGRWIRTKCIRTLERVGQFSYSLYLVNYPILVIMGKPARALGSNSNLFVHLVFLAIGIVVSTVAGYALYYFVERHGQSKPSEA